MRHENSQEHQNALKDWDGEVATMGKPSQVCTGLNISIGKAKFSKLGLVRELLRHWNEHDRPGVKGSILEQVIAVPWLLRCGWFSLVSCGFLVGLVA